MLADRIKITNVILFLFTLLIGHSCSQYLLSLNSLLSLSYPNSLSFILSSTIYNIKINKFVHINIPYILVAFILPFEHRALAHIDMLKR